MAILEDFQDIISDEVYHFLECLDQISDRRMDVGVWRKPYGYFVTVGGRINEYLYELELRLYESNHENQVISYMMIQYFQVAPERCGFGTQLFNHLLEAIRCFNYLVMIRLEANDELGEKFWIHQNKFRLKGQAVDWINGDTRWCDIDCLSKPGELNIYRYIYDVRRCHCESCQSYYAST